MTTKQVILMGVFGVGAVTLMFAIREAQMPTVVRKCRNLTLGMSREDAKKYMNGFVSSERFRPAGGPHGVDIDRTEVWFRNQHFILPHPPSYVVSDKADRLISISCGAGFYRFQPGGFSEEVNGK